MVSFFLLQEKYIKLYRQVNKSHFIILQQLIHL